MDNPELRELHSRIAAEENRRLAKEKMAGAIAVLDRIGHEFGLEDYDGCVELILGRKIPQDIPAAVRGDYLDHAVRYIEQELEILYKICARNRSNGFPSEVSRDTIEYRLDEAMHKASYFLTLRAY